MQPMKHNNRNVFIRAYLFLLISSLMYGGNVIAGRLMADQMPPFTLSAIRAILGLGVLLPLAWAQIKKAPKPNKSELLQLLIIAILGVILPYNTLLLGLQHTTGTNASIIFATCPAVTNILLFIFYKVRLTKLQTIGLITSFMGLLVVFTQGSLTHLFSFKLGLGEMILFINVLSVGLFNLIGQNIMKKFSSLVTSVYVLVFSIIILVPMGVWQHGSFEWHLSLSQWLVVLYMGIFAAGLAFFLNLYGIDKIGSGQAAIFNNMQYVFSITLSIIILGESLASYHWMGFILVISGVILSLSKPPEKKAHTLSIKSSEQESVS